jgi:enoyl-CoA hydratase/carnithine racemase
MGAKDATRRVEKKAAELITRRGGAVGWIVFSNPARFNAMTFDMWRALPEALAAFDADEAVRLVVLAGDGDKAFVSGADISQFEQNRASEEARAAYNRAVEAAYLAPILCAKPVVAKIRGICMGGGLGLAAACDVRFCSDDAVFRMPAARQVRRPGGAADGFRAPGGAGRRARPRGRRLRGDRRRERAAIAHRRESGDPRGAEGRGRP